MAQAPTPPVVVVEALHPGGTGAAMANTIAVLIEQ
jgi:hypothetical protein